MKIDITHARNPLLGWDIQVKATADKGEKIVAGRVSVNGFKEVEQDMESPLQQWQNELSQKGQYPGDNKVLVTVTDASGNETSAEDSWS